MKQNKTHTNGFKVPKDYISSFDTRLFDEIELNDVISSKPPFTVPTHYFDSVEKRLLQSINEDQNTRQNKGVISISLIKKMSYAAAASLALFLLVRTFTNQNQTPSISSIELDTIDAYIANEEIDLDSYELMALLQDSEEVLEEQPLELSEEAIETYLLNTIEVPELLETDLL